MYAQTQEPMQMENEGATHFQPGVGCFLSYVSPPILQKAHSRANTGVV